MRIASPSHAEQGAGRLLVAGLIASAAVGPLALNVLAPNIPGMAGHFDVPYGTAQLAISLYAVFVAAGQLALGPLSDRVGRRPVLVGGLALYVIGSLLATLAPDLATVLVARCLQAAGGAAGIVIVRAMVYDLFARDRAVGILSTITMAMSVTPAIAPLIGGLAEALWGWRLSMGVTVVAGAATLALVFAAAPESLRERGETRTLRELASTAAALMRAPGFLRYALPCAAHTAAYIAFLAVAPYVAITLMGLDPTIYGAWSILAFVGYTFGTFLSARLAGRLGLDRMVVVGSGFAVLITLAQLGAAAFGLLDAALLLTAFGILSIAHGLTQPSAVIGAIGATPQAVGMASSVLGCLQMGAGAALAQLLAVFEGAGAWPLLIGMAAVTVLGTLAYLLMPASAGPSARAEA